MPNKLSAYIDLAKLQGAYRMNLKGKDGAMHDCIVINLSKARAKPSAVKPERVNLSLSLVPNRDGKDEYGNTHWITEPTSREERERHPDLRLPILGNARELGDAEPKRELRPPVAEAVAGALAEGMEDDEIPF